MSGFALNISLNATLFVQVCNFVVAYLVLRFLLLEPVYRHIIRGEKKEQGLHNTIESAQEDVAKYRSQYEAVWQSCRDYFRTHKPALEAPRDADEGQQIPPLTYPSMTKPEAEKLVAQMSELVEQSVEGDSAGKGSRKKPAGGAS